MKTIDYKRVAHIFRSAPGHLADTRESRALLEDVANDINSSASRDKFGNTWSARTGEDGVQVWVQVRGDFIVNGGVNYPPRKFNTQTGLASPIRPTRK